MSNAYITSVMYTLQHLAKCVILCYVDPMLCRDKNQSTIANFCCEMVYFTLKA